MTFVRFIRQHRINKQISIYVNVLNTFLEIGHKKTRKKLSAFTQLDNGCDNSCHKFPGDEDYNTDCLRCLVHNYTFKISKIYIHSYLMCSLLLCCLCFLPLLNGSISFCLYICAAYGQFVLVLRRGRWDEVRLQRTYCMSRKQ